MKELISHIDALVLEHDCVIIPGFGGFVLNKESASIGNVILPPRVTIGFNPALKHNDGLLAESYMNVNSVSYDVACRMINDAVRKINGFLQARQSVTFPKLGVFSQNEDSQVLFTPSKKLFAHPSVFGYTPISVKRLVDIVAEEKQQIIETKRLGVKRLFTASAAVAAAVLIFFMSSIPVQNTNNREYQQSGFFVDKMKPVQQAQTEESVATDSLLASDDQQIDLSEALKPEVEEISVPKKEVETKPLVEAAKVNNQYYIIVGSGLNKRQAEDFVAKLKREGYGGAMSLPASERIRIAIAGFQDKAEAERFLNGFRANNKQYSDAWLLTKR